MELLFLGLDVSGWLTGAGAVVIVGIIVTILRKKGINIKKYLGLASVITKELGEAFLETSDVFAAADNAIKEDGRLKENSVKDILKEGKEAIIEWKDVILIIKPKR